MYSAVYKCVCKQYSEQLYADLMTHVRSRLGQWSAHLTQVAKYDVTLQNKFNFHDNVFLLGAGH